MSREVSIEMKMLVVVLVILFAHSINGQFESCNMTILTDFPECLQAFLGAGGNVTDGEMINLLCANASCQTAIANINSCNATDQEVVSSLQAAVTFGCIPVPDGGICFDRVQDGFADLSSTLINVPSSCFQEYIMGICSEYCLQTIGMLTDQLGCCYNEAIRVTTSLAPDQTQSDFFLNVFTSDYFSICNSVSAQTFCQNGSTIAPSRCPTAIQGLFGGNDTCSNVARQLITSGGNISNGDMPDVACLAHLVEFSDSCNMSFILTDCQMATVELFGPNDDCANTFSVLPNNTDDRISFDMANVALNTVCGTVGCRSRISNFTNRCLPTMDSLQYNLLVLELGCRTNDAGSCFAVQQSGALNDLSAAFQGGVCTTAVLGACSGECSVIIRDAVRENGCCVLELALAGARQFGVEIDIDAVLELCSITSPGRCPQQTEGNFRTIDDDNGSSVIVSYAVLISLLALLPIILTV